ncbi:MAG: peptidase S41 [Prevotella sp.]|nr:peptidase S41 [Prevotella sp.]
MKKLFMTVLMMVSVTVLAQANPLWMRFPAISPDGQTIAFSYKGDIYTVSATGGQARQLTTNAAYDAYPVWSPDGRQIAFASDREGGFDVYVMNHQGGTPKRLTTHSANEIPIAFKDNQNVLFSSSQMTTVQASLLPESVFPQVYEVSIEGGRPRLFSPITMENISINSQGDLLYHDCKGYEDTFRKHHQSAITRDIWLKRGEQFTRLTSFRGEDRTPVWAPDGKSFYYLSERDGTFNVWKRNVDGTGEQQITKHEKNPVRFLTAARNGMLCYGYDGEIYINKDGAEQKVAVDIVADCNDRDLVRSINTSGATEISVSPKNKEVAFVMHGDVYVTSVDYKTTRQITNTPEQERNVSFSPDGRSLVYAAERNGVWQIYRTVIVNKNEKQFAYATDLKEERLTKTDNTSQQPQFSPDGKEIAFFENRGDLCVMNLQTKAVRTVLDGKYQYSYADGDLWFEWSPDSRWLLCSYIGTGGWHSPDVALVSASGNGEVHNLTNSGYSDSNAKWAMGGKAMIYSSDRAGYRSHGSWGAEEDVYIMFFDLDAYERFRMSKEEKELLAEAEKADKEEQKEKKDDKDKKKTEQKKDDKNRKTVELSFDLDNARDRILRLTANSSHLGDAILSPGGDTLYYQAMFEDGYDLWCNNLRERKTELVIKGVGGGNMQADKNFKHLYLLSKGIKKLDLAKNKQEAVSFEAPFCWKPYQEREYLFNHVWRQVNDKFYDPNIHGIDWEGYRTTYERFLPHINNNYDFRDMLSEMLGELNGSHTGARYYPEGATLKTASLGLFFDPDYDGDGLRVLEVIKRGPFAVRNTGVTPGCIIEQIDGHSIKAGEDYNWMLDGKADKPVRVTVCKPQGGQTFDVVVKPVSQSQLSTLVYKRWVDRNRHLVDSLSGGQVAYVHIKSMNSEGFREVYSDLLSDENRNRKAVIVDERYNGGGWLHDDLCTLLSGRLYHNFVPRDKYVGRDPLNKWVGKSCVLMNEDCYSNGSGFPWVYRELGIGPLIGSAVAGTATSVWWETLMDRSLVFGIPQVGKKDMKGQYMENQELFPDIEVYNTPEDYINGRDPQLEAAIREMMK